MNSKNYDWMVKTFHKSFCMTLLECFNHLTPLPMHLSPTNLPEHLQRIGVWGEKVYGAKFCRAGVRMDLSVQLK